MRYCHSNYVLLFCLLTCRWQQVIYCRVPGKQTKVYIWLGGLRIASQPCMPENAPIITLTAHIFPVCHAQAFSQPIAQP